MNLLDLKKTVKNVLKKNIWSIQMNCAEIIFVHENRTKNIGDLMSCPSHFFPKMRQKSIVANIWRFKEKFSLKNKLIIVGGGGLLQPYYSEPVENILKLSTYNRVIFWGVGLDNHISERITYPNDRKEAVFGVRDFFSYSDIYKKLHCQYVPCASCMSSLFDKYADTPTRFPVKLYLHKHYMPPPNNSILQTLPLMTNEDSQSFQKVIEYLADADFVITNSYHGMYCSTLLGKRVVVLPWYDKGSDQSGYSTKFKNFEFTPTFCQKWEDVLSVLPSTNSYPLALKECRERNLSFYDNFVTPLM